MKDKLYNTLIVLPFLWTFTGLILFRNGDKLMIVAIVISIVATLLHFGVRSIKRNVKNRGLWLVLAITAYTAFSYYYHGASSREMRALMGTALLLLTFPRELINARILKLLTVLGSVILLFSTYYFSVYLHLPRAAWPINAIPHGTMGATITVLALVFLLNAHNYRDKIILALALFLSVCGLAMNPTRGIWLALIIAMIIILLPKLKIKQINWKYTLIALVILSLGLYVSKPKFEQRIEQTQAEIKATQAGNLDTSIGIRLQLWMAAAKITSENPILGSGDSHQLLLKNLALKGDITEIVTIFSHYHNQYLDRVVKGGGIGFILLLAAFIYPFVSTSTGINRQMAIAVITIYAAAGLTDVPLNHGAPLFMYLLLMFTLKEKDEANY
ncbi:MAG: O-antigen ligase [Oleiphilaceae bacterium]